MIHVKQPHKQLLVISLIIIFNLAMCGCSSPAPTVTSNSDEIDTDISEQGNIAENTVQNVEKSTPTPTPIESYDIQGFLYDENMEKSLETIFMFNKPNGYSYFGNVNSTGDGSGICNVKFKDKKSNNIIEVERLQSTANDSYIKECFKTYLQLNVIESDAIDWYSPTEIITSLEEKEHFQSPYGILHILYMKSTSQSSNEELTSEIVIFNINQYDILIRCTYNEMSDYQGILLEQLPIIINGHELENSKFSNTVTISYGDYEYILNESFHLDTVNLVFGFNIPDEYTDINTYNDYYVPKSSINNAYFWNDTASISIGFLTDSEHYSDIIKFISTGTFEEGKENEYGHKLLSMEKDSVETIYGTANIVYKTIYNPNMLQNEASEYAIVNANGYDVLIICSYKNMSEYKGILKKMIPEITQKSF